MKLENSFDVPVGMEDAWLALTDIERLVPCMPGAELTEVVDDSTYKGAVAVRLGPVALKFNGTAKFEELDESAHHAVVKTRGSDTKGRGNVEADVSFSLRENGATTTVQIETDLRLSGMVAQYGRGAGMISDVATYWVEQFASCLHKRLSEETPSARAETQASASSAPAIPLFSVVLKAFWSATKRFFRRIFTNP